MSLVYAIRRRCPKKSFSFTRNFVKSVQTISNLRDYLCVLWPLVQSRPAPVKLVKILERSRVTPLLTKGRTGPSLTTAAEVGNSSASFPPGPGWKPPMTEPRESVYVAGPCHSGRSFPETQREGAPVALKGGGPPFALFALKRGAGRGSSPFGRGVVRTRHARRGPLVAGV